MRISSDQLAAIVDCDTMLAKKNHLLGWIIVAIAGVWAPVSLQAAPFSAPQVEDEEEEEYWSKEDEPIEFTRSELFRAQALNQWFEKSDHWAFGGIVLLSLGEEWHPVAMKSVLSALRAKGEYLPCYAVEQLFQTDSDLLRFMLPKDVLEELITVGLKGKTNLRQERIMELLSNVFSEVHAETPKDWIKWWKDNRDQHWLPQVIVEKDPEEEELGSVSSGFVERAFDLRSAGMELVIVMDSTGSMQTTIDATVTALKDFTAIIEGISPKFRLGLVEYKDTTDISSGARIVEPLNKNPDKVRNKLEGIAASGGGDFPESVLGGLEAALSDKIGWERSANKLVVIVGDAPPHSRDLDKAIAAADGANKSPFGVDASLLLEVTKEGNSASKRGVRPFIISALGVGTSGVHGDTRSSFTDIAEAGGGAYAEVLLNTRSGQASADIAAHILSLSFGSRWSDQTDAFVEIFFAYRKAGLFR